MHCPIFLISVLCWRHANACEKGAVKAVDRRKAALQGNLGYAELPRAEKLLGVVDAVGGEKGAKIHACERVECGGEIFFVVA